MPGQYASLYDNIFIPDDYKLGTVTAGTFEYPENYHWDWHKVRERVSDHLPVYLVLGAREFALREGGDSQLGSKTASAAAACIDLNSASTEQLNRLVHVGPARAEAIPRGTPWRSVDELVRAKGLDEARVGDIATSGQICPVG